MGEGNRAAVRIRSLNAAGLGVAPADAADRLGNSIEIAQPHYRNNPNVETPLIYRKAKCRERTFLPRLATSINA